MVRCGNLCLLRPRLLSTYRRPSGNWRGDDNHYYYGDETRFMEFENATRGWYERNKKYINRLCVTGAIGGAYYWYHLEKTPITGRSRFISVGTKEEQILGSAGLDQIIKEHGTNMLSPSHPIVRRVQTIVDRLLKALDPELRGNERAWRVHVINSSLVNAMVLPTGDIFVFTGIIPVAQDDAGLAAIIGHEMAHKIARHGAEKVSLYHFFHIFGLMLKIFVIGGEFGMPFEGVLKDLLLYLPFSRRCESEADYIGLILMARACYEPRAAISVWQRMSQVESNLKVPTFLSTHPASSKRIQQLTKWLPEAEREFERSGCYEFDRFFR